jgi:hypothetical protein
MKRYDCLRAIAPRFGDALVVTNIGAVRHEWQALRPHHGNFHLQNLGLTSSMALGLALALPHRKVVAFDGDGSLLLNLGSLATIANQHPKNLIHIVFDNECYESSHGDGGTGGPGGCRARLRICQCDLRDHARGVRDGIWPGFRERRPTLHSCESRTGRRRCSGGGIGFAGEQILVRSLHREKREHQNSHFNVVASQRAA